MNSRRYTTNRSNSADDDSTTDEELAKLDNMAEVCKSVLPRHITGLQLTIDELRELLDRRQAEEKRMKSDIKKDKRSRRVITGYIAGIHSTKTSVRQIEESPVHILDGSQPPVKMRIQVTAGEGEVSGKIVSIRKPHKVNTNANKTRKNFPRIRSSEEQIKRLRSQEKEKRKVGKKRERTKGERELRHLMRDAQRKATEIMKDWSINKSQEKQEEIKRDETQEISSEKLLGNPNTISLFDTREKIAEDICVNMLQSWKCKPVIGYDQELNSSAKVPEATNSDLQNNLLIPPDGIMLDSGTASPHLMDNDTCWVYGDELCENSCGLPIDMQSFFVSSPEGGVELMDDRTLMQSVSLDFLHDLLPDEGNNGQNIHRREVLEVWISQTDLECMDDLDDIQIVAVVPSKDYPNSLKMSDLKPDMHQSMALIAPLCEPSFDETNHIQHDHQDYDSDFPFGTGTDDEMYAAMDAVLLKNVDSPCILTSCCSGEKMQSSIVSQAAPLLSRLSIEEAISGSDDMTVGLPVCDDYQLAVEDFLDLPAAENMLEDLGYHVMDDLLDSIDTNVNRHSSL
uniref:BZIP domain-containing protein n=1 Tax=Heterorhabditis bacteriophora TaxID=37862 RepID=A0A1I7XNL2_HETBA